MNNTIYHKITNISQNGITLESQGKKIHICFDDCARTFATQHGTKFNKCVATRDIMTLSFTFYTQPKTKVVFKRCFWKNFIKGNSAVNKFLELQKKIVEAGYSSYDLS